MEQLLFILFVLFSIVSALLERRKRRKQLEEQQRRRTQQQPQPQPQSRPQPQLEEEEEVEVGWPFGSDPFQVELPQPRQSEMPAERTERNALEREREALAAERRALEMERLALEAARRTHGGVLRQRMSDRLRQRATREQAEQPSPAIPLQAGRWRLDPARARDAVVYAEILGPPRAERPEIH